MASFQLSAMRRNVDLRSTPSTLVTLRFRKLPLPGNNMKAAFHSKLLLLTSNFISEAQEKANQLVSLFKLYPMPAI